MERLEKQRGNVNQNPGEPLLDAVQGFRGTGRSAFIVWMRQLMEESLDLEHSVDFVCLAFQNAMSAQINEHTITTGAASQREAMTEMRVATSTNSR